MDFQISAAWVSCCRTGVTRGENLEEEEDFARTEGQLITSEGMVREVGWLRKQVCGRGDGAGRMSKRGKRVGTERGCNLRCDVEALQPR